ncbi:MAG: Type 1 glutamine amidotransferase-like domain-containing protein [Erysipelotrichaceae bacterium]|nr:Type 1 glutamine amidotransferase-like domain-containing protein [Erysipelotrichaceae bacterium]
MELIRSADKAQIEELQQTGGLWKGSAGKWHTRNSRILDRQPKLEEGQVLCVISTLDPKVELEWIRDEKTGIDYPHVKKDLDISCLKKVEEQESEPPVQILMNTSMFDEKWCRSALKPYLSKEDEVAVLAFSFYDDTKNLDDWNRQYQPGRGIWYRANTDVFQWFGIPKEQVHWINYFTQTPAQMKNILANCSVVLYTGGAPDLMMKRIREKKLQPLLKKWQGTVMGYSAGAMMQLAEYHITPDSDYPAFVWEKGLGYTDVFDIEVHYAREKLQKESIQRTLEERNRPVYAVADDGGMIVKGNQILNLFGNVELFQPE